MHSPALEKEKTLPMIQTGDLPDEQQLCGKGPGSLSKDTAKLFTVVHYGKMRDHENKLKKDKPSLNTRKIFLSPKTVKHGDKLPREAVPSPPLGV